MDTYAAVIIKITVLCSSQASYLKSAHTNHPFRHTVLFDITPLHLYTGMIYDPPIQRQPDHFSLIPLKVPSS